VWPAAGAAAGLMPPEARPLGATNQLIGALKQDTFGNDTDMPAAELVGGVTL